VANTSAAGLSAVASIQTKGVRKISRTTVRRIWETTAGRFRST
jgi:hypothetical protein